MTLCATSPYCKKIVNRKITLFLDMNLSVSGPYIAETLWKAINAKLPD